VYLFYIGFVAPLLGIEVVDKPYRQFDAEKLLGPLRYPPGMLRIQVPKETLSLEEIRERNRKAREERERLDRERREREERERIAREREERERAEREKAEAEKKAAEAAKAEAEKASSTQFKELNLAPIKDLVGKIYSLHEAGQLDIQETKFTVMVGFKVEKDGSISNLKVIKGSGSKMIDKYSTEILWNIGESHALGPLASISSSTIQLELDDKMARLTITGFAPSAEEAKELATRINTLFKFLAWNNKSTNPAIAELMSLVKVTSDNKRINASLAISRDRASVLMQQQFGKAATTSP
jgi:hypothetical protein